MTPTRLSIIIPTHETRELVERCLASLESERDAGTEIVVVDDGSTDGTAERISRRFPWARLLRHESPLSFAASVNDGLATAKGELLLLLNSDTELRPGALAALEAAFDANPRLGIAGAALENPDGSPQWSSGREPSLLWLLGLASGLPRWLRERLPAVGRTPGQSLGGAVDWVTGAAMAIRRDTYRRLGPLETAYSFYAQDMDYCLRARDAGVGVEVVPGFEVMHVGGATVSRSEGAVDSLHPGLLTSDLLTWATMRRGPIWARLARCVLRLGLALRIGARRAVALLLPRTHGKPFRDATTSLASAARSLRMPSSAVRR